MTDTDRTHRRCLVCQARLSRYNDSKFFCFAHQDTEAAAIERSPWFVRESAMWQALSSATKTVEPQARVSAGR